MKLRYEMNTRRGPPTFDFYTWLVLGKMTDPDEIVIDDFKIRIGKFPAKTVRKRIDSIIMPGPALAGLRVRRGRDGEDYIRTHMMQDLVKIGEFKRLKSVLPAATGVEYTVTLRNTRHNFIRNSDIELWTKFAKEIGAHLIKDYDDEAIHLHKRMAYYAGAKMNFGVTNGPMFLLTLTEYPVMMFDCVTNKNGWGTHGIEEGSQLPWAREHQRLVWKRPTMDDLMQAANGHCP